MLRCLFTNIVSDFCRSKPHGKLIKSRYLPFVGGIFFSSQATKMELDSACDKRYQQAITALNSLQSNIQNLAIKDDQRKHKISSTIKFAARVGISLDDIDRLSIIHVSGTKGKGSTCAMTESILRHHGYKTGFFSSPHLVEVRERIQINGQPISRELFSTYFWEVYNKLTDTAPLHNNEMPFYFSFLTVMAFQVFLKEQVEVAIMEVGIGGEYDTTNVVRKPVVCGVTSLGLDHVSVLGDTMEKIAWQKGGIFKPGVPAVTMIQDKASLKVLQGRSEEIGCPLYLIPDFSEHQITSEDPDFQLGLMGKVQKKNAALALQLCKIWLSWQNNDKLYQEMSQRARHSDMVNHIPVLEAYTVNNKTKQGLQHCTWRGRNQILCRPGVTYYLDGAHTKESLQQCIEWFQEEASKETKFSSGKVVKILLFNMTGDRDVAARLTQLQDIPLDHVIFSPNYLYTEKTSPDLLKTSVSKENQLNRCSMMKEIWDQRLHYPNCSRSEVKQQQVKFLEDLGQLPMVPVQLETSVSENLDVSSEPLPIQSSVISCLSEALYWATQGRDPSIPRMPPQLDVPDNLQNAAHVQLLVTGSIHLVGGVLKLIDPVVSDAENQKELTS